MLSFCLNLTMFSQVCPPPPPANVLAGPGFETCVVNPGQTLNAAINNGCEPGWQSANGTPSICNAIPNPAVTGGVINAPQGTNFACLGSGTAGGCRNEAMFQTVNLCPGATYQLTFQYFNITGAAGTISVAMANGLVNTTNTGQPCFTANGQMLGNITLAAGVQSWAVFNSVPFVANPANNQLVVWINDLPGGANFDAGFDLVNLVCIQSPLIPQIATQNSGGGQYLFSGTSNTIPGFNVNSWCWTFGDGASASGQNVTHTYSTPGAYQVCLAIADNCGCQSTLCIPVIYDPCLCSDVSQVLGSGQVSWNNLAQAITSDVVIPPGTHLTISNSNLSINTSCKFVVMRGASMSVTNNSTLTNACDGQRWEGVIVWGNTDALHSDVYINTNQFSQPGNLGVNDPGLLRVTSGSTLAGMRRGMQAQRWGWDAKNEALFQSITGISYVPANDYTKYYGGIIRTSSNAQFRDNRLSAEILGYPHPNYSEFGSCRFFSSTPTQVLSNSGNEGVNIWGTDNILFANCRFEDVGARGITALDAGITVRRCTIDHIYRGIQTGSGPAPNGTVQIGLHDNLQRNYFQNNTDGIWSDGILKLNVHTNTFQNQTSGGVTITGASSYDVWDNDFMNNNRGVDLWNTAADLDQYVHCGIHNGDSYAIRVRGKCDGMTFFDNEFNSDFGDLLVAQAVTPQGNFDGEIFNSQGQSGAAVFNLFSENELLNDIRSNPANTVLFNYFPPLTENPNTDSRTLPDCDIDDNCPPTIFLGLPNVNNYLNHPRTFGVADDCLDLDTRERCENRECMDSLRARIAWLEQQIAGGAAQYQTEKDLTERRFNTDERMLIWEWYEENDLVSIVDMLEDYNTVADRQLLYGVYAKKRMFPEASAVLEALPESDTELAWFKGVQRIYLQFAPNPAVFQPTAGQDSLLELVSSTIYPVGSHARTIYFLLHGVWLEPEVEEEDETGGGERNQPQTSGVQEQRVRIQPNPADETLTVSLNTAALGGRLRLFDVQGRSVGNLTVNTSTLTIPTNHLPEGLYWIQCLTPEGRILDTVKVYIQH